MDRLKIAAVLGIIFSSVTFFNFAYANAIDLSLLAIKHDPVPGGVAIIKFNLAPDEEVSRCLYGHSKVLCKKTTTDHSNSWVAIVGIDIKTAPGQYQVAIKVRNKQGYIREFVKNLHVKPKKYPSESFNIADHNKVVPNKITLARIQKETQEIKSYYKHWSDASAELDLLLPVKGRFSSPFGYTRILNGITQKPHLGLDIAAPLGTKIKAPANGKVIGVGNYFIPGNTVFIDHGQGFISSYSHLDTILVHKNQQVKRGDPIGTIGKTGRVTGPHLHWTLSLNDARINPANFIVLE